MNREITVHKRATGSLMTLADIFKPTAINKAWGTTKAAGKSERRIFCAVMWLQNDRDLRPNIRIMHG